MTLAEPRPPKRPETEIDPVELLGVIWAGKLWIASMTLLALLAGLFLVLRAEPLFEARGLLQLEARSGTLGLPEGMQDLIGDAGPTGSSAADAEIEIMKSRMVMTRVVQELGLQIHATPRPLPGLGLLPARLGLPDPGLPVLQPYQWGNEGITIGEMAVSEHLVGKDLILRITAVGYSLLLPDGRRLEGHLRERLALPDEGLSLVVDELTGPIGREFILGRRSLEDAVTLVQEAFSVGESPKRSSILRVTLTDADPRRAEAILNAISRAYVDQNIARSAAEAQNSLSFIEDQLPVAEVAVTTAQDALNRYRQAQDSVDVDYETRMLLERATKIEADLNALALQEEEAKARYTVNHPAYRALLENRASLNRQLEEIRAATSNLPETQKEIFNLTRNLEVAQEIYVQLLNRAQALRVVRASTVGSVRIIDTAFSNGKRVQPRTTRTLAIFLLAGLLAGTGFVLLSKLLRRGIRGSDEIEGAGLPVFATVGFAAGAVNPHRRKGLLPVLAIERPDDPVVEALRSLRTSLHFGMLDATTNSIMFTSAAPGAGKSFVAMNLAVVAAQAGQRVCLVDADLRKGYLRRYLGKEKGVPGLAELLASEKTLDKVLLPGPVEGLSVIPSGRYPPNPSELLMRAEFPLLLGQLNDRFDLIIVDSPPALAVTDPVVIGRFTGATIVVLRHLESMMGEVEAVRRSFETAAIKVSGAVLNGYRAPAGRYGDGYDYRYAYKSGQG